MQLPVLRYPKYLHGQQHQEHHHRQGSHVANVGKMGPHEVQHRDENGSHDRHDRVDRSYMVRDPSPAFYIGFCFHWYFEYVALDQC